MILPLFIVAAVLAAHPVRAASPADTEFAAGMVHRIAECAVRARENQVRDVLRMDFRTPAYQERLRSEAGRTERCVGMGTLRFDSILFAGAIAESLIERHPGGVGAAVITGADPIAPPIVGRSETEVMALCLVQARPDVLPALLATAPGSKAERAALAPIAPTVQPCLKAGVSVRLNAAAMRAMLALAAWRIADHKARALGSVPR